MSYRPVGASVARNVAECAKKNVLARGLPAECAKKNVLARGLPEHAEHVPAHFLSRITPPEIGLARVPAGACSGRITPPEIGLARVPVLLREYDLERVLERVLFWTIASLRWLGRATRKTEWICRSESHKARIELRSRIRMDCPP